MLGLLGGVAGFLLFSGAGNFGPGWGAVGWLVLVVVGLVLATNAYLYIVLPLTIRRQLDLDLTAPPEPLDPAGPYEHADRDYLAEVGRALGPHGFRRVARVRPGRPGGFAPDLVLFFRPGDATGDPGEAVSEEGVVAVLVPPQNGAAARRSLTYAREFADGTKAAVGTSYESAAPPAPGVRTLTAERFAVPAAAADLLAAGRAAAAAWGAAGPIRWDGAADDWAGRFDLALRREAARHVRAGMHAAPPDAAEAVRVAAAAGGPHPAVPPGVYPATRRGAYRVVWRLLFPVKQVGRRRARTRADRLLSEWGVEPTPRP